MSWRKEKALRAEKARRKDKTFTVRCSCAVAWLFVLAQLIIFGAAMSYYDDDDDDDDYSSEEEDLFYHNYSVDYANQILGGQHTLCSALPRQRRKRRSPRLMRVSTWDQMPIETRHRLPPASSLHSRPKNNHHHQQQGEISSPSIARLPSLEATGEELERRANKRTEPSRQVSLSLSIVSRIDLRSFFRNNRRRSLRHHR